MAKRLLYRDKDGNEYEVASEGGTGGGSEPSQYLKDAEVTSGVLKITKKDGTLVNYSASSIERDFTVSGQTSVTITHDLGIAHPYIVCVDSDGNTVYGAVEYISTTQFKLEFNTAFTGTVYIH